MSKTITIIVVIVIIVLLGWLIFGKSSNPTIVDQTVDNTATTTDSGTTVSNDSSTNGLTQDAASIDAQINNLNNDSANVDAGMNASTNY